MAKFYLFFLGVALFSLGFGYVLNKRLGNRSSGIADRLYKPLWLWAAVIGLLLCTQQALKYYNFFTGAFDLGVISQAFANTLQGEFFSNTFIGLDKNVSCFAQHTLPIFFLILPIYALLQHPLILVALQSIAVAASIAGMACLTRQISGSTRMASVIAICYSLFPPLYLAGLFDFHGDTLALPFIVALMAASLQSRVRISLAMLILALSCKEYIALTTFAWGVYLYAKHGRTKAGLSIAIISAGWFVAAHILQEIIRPDFIPSMFEDHYAFLFGRNAGRTFIFNKQNAENLVFLLAPTLLVCMAYPWTLLLIALPLTKDLAVGMAIENHRSVPMSPLLWYGVVRALHKIRTDNPMRARWLAHALVIAGLLCSALYSETPWSQRFYRIWRRKYWNPQQRTLLQEALAQISGNGAVSTTMNLHPHLINHRYVYIFPVTGAHPAAEYIVLDKSKLSAKDTAVLDSLASHGHYVVRLDNAEAIVLHKSNGGK
ncbi:MAG: DUF2079 domain-containing protein [Chitinivibrionales bacterium]|nr:DUF2079 domain-containing protein [Chitinivibrionales bacterium]